LRSAPLHGPSWPKRAIDMAARNVGLADRFIAEVENVARIAAAPQ
jgi:hypothetical protein